MPCGVILNWSRLTRMFSMIYSSGGVRMIRDNRRGSNREKSDKFLPGHRSAYSQICLSSFEPWRRRQAAVFALPRDDRLNKKPGCDAGKVLFAAIIILDWQ
jgi:hypothetical protein